MFAGFVSALFLASRVLPGVVQERVLQQDGTRLQYKINGFLLFSLLIIVVSAGAWLKLFSLTVVHAHFWSLFIVANVFAFVFAFVLFLKGRRVGVRSVGASGSGAVPAIRDFFYGTEFDPAWLGVDLKMFSYRPSLMGLGLINASFASVQYEIYGHISSPMWIYQIFTFIYLANHFQFEQGILFTWDVIAERFGWMLVWGDYVLVPFFYSIPGWYLVHKIEPIPASSVACLIALYVVGFWLFRGANEQKHKFKLNPNVKIWGRSAETIGGRLLASGFWGIGRKLNYTGEVCLYWAWTLPCGAVSVIPHLVPLWLTTLLGHRAWRDEKRCREKYGVLWMAYCERVRFRMIPFIY